MADKENIYGIRYEVDIDQLKSSTKEVSQQIKLANAQFNEASSSLENWAEDTEGVSAKITQLNSILDAQKTKLNNSKNEFNKYADEMAYASEQIEDLKKKKQEAINQYGKESKEVKELEKEIKSLSREYENNKEKCDKLSVSILNQQADINKTEKSIGNYEDSLKDLEKATDNVDDATDELGGGFTVLKGTLASLIADGISNFISSIGSAIEETKEFRREMSLLKAVADENNVAFDEVKDAYMDLLATSGDEGASTEALNNLLSAGFDESNLDQIVAGVEGLAIRFKDTLKQEGIADSIQEWIGSEGESLTGNFAEALERMGYNLEDVTAQTKGFTDEQRQQWVMNTLAKEGLVELSEEYRKNNAGLIESSNAQFKLTDALSNFAEVTEPVLTAVKGGFADLLNTLFGLGTIDLSPFTNGIKVAFDTINGLLSGELSFSDFIGNIVQSITDGVPKLVTAGADIVANIGNGLKENIPKLLENGLTLLDSFADMLTVNMPKMIESGISFIRNIVQGLMDSLPMLISKVPEIISKFANVINDNAPTILKAGVGIILDIIKGLISAIPTLIANIPKIITAIVDVWSAFNWIDLGKNVSKFLGDGIKSMIEFVKTQATSVNTTVVDAIKNLPTTLLNFGKDMMSKFGGAIKGAISTVKTNTKAVFDAVVNTFKDLPSKMLSIGKDIVRGIWDGITGMAGWLADKVGGFVDGIISAFKNEAEIESPSKRTKREVGTYLGQGVGVGVMDSLGYVKGKIKRFNDAILDEMSSQMGDVALEPNLLSNFTSSMSGLRNHLTPALAGAGASVGATNVTFNQYNTSPKALDSLEVYRNTQRQLKQYKLWKGRGQ